MLKHLRSIELDVGNRSKGTTERIYSGGTLSDVSRGVVHVYVFRNLLKQMRQFMNFHVLCALCVVFGWCAPPILRPSPSSQRSARNDGWHVEGVVFK